MAAIFGLFASERATARPAYSLPKLQALHERLQSILEADEQTEAAVEVIREMTEALLWGEQNDHNENFFDFFCEKSILADFVRILGRPVPKTVKVQLLQSLSMLIQNIRRPTSLYYLFSNNYVNQLIATQFDWSDEEILGYYISFLKSLALRLNEETIKFFFQERSQQFPLFTEAVRFFSHHDQMVRTSVRTLTLRVFNVKDEAMQSFVLKISRPYFRHLAEHLCLLWRTLDESKGQPNALDEANAEQQDLVMYISDVLEMKNANLSRIVVKMVLDHACYPMLLESLAAEDQSLLSWRTALFLLQEFFQTSQQRELVEPLATSLLATPGAASAPARSSTSSRSTLKEAVDVWEPFKAEDPEESVGVTVNAFSELYRPKILGHLLKEEPLLTAALLRSCLGLGISNLLEQGLLIEAGLLPPLPGHAVTTPAAPAAPPLEVLHRAAAALEDHSSLNMVAIQALARLCLDVAFTPEARSLSGSKDWREKPLEAIQRGLRSAAQQVRSFIHHLGDGFLDLFGEAWEQEHEPPQLKDLCSNTQCLVAEWAPSRAGAGAGASDRREAFKAARVLLTLRQLHRELSGRDAAPRAFEPPPRAGGLIESALAPLGVESPLEIPEEEFHAAEGSSFKLERMDRIVCGVVTPEGRHSRYMILHKYLLLLVQPDVVQPGWAVVKTLLPVRRVEPHLEADPRLLGLRWTEDGESFLLTLTFEDTKRCSIAESHLKKCRTKVRERLSQKVLAFVEKLCD